MELESELAVSYSDSSSFEPAGYQTVGLAAGYQTTGLEAGDQTTGVAGGALQVQVSPPVKVQSELSAFRHL